MPSSMNADKTRKRISVTVSNYSEANMNIT